MLTELRQVITRQRYCLSSDAEEQRQYCEQFPFFKVMRVRAVAGTPDAWSYRHKTFEKDNVGHGRKHVRARGLRDEQELLYDYLQTNQNLQGQRRLL